MNTFAIMIAAITRKFYPRGTHRLLKFVFNPKKFKWQGVITYDTNLRINIDTSYNIERELFFKGHYYKCVTDIINKIVKSGDVILDIGANIGTRSLIMGKSVGHMGNVFAFEPHPDVFKRLNDNIKLNNFNNITTFPIALSDKTSTEELYSYIDDNRNSSLYPLNDIKGGEHSKIAVSTIDSIVEEAKINRLNLIKINARGSDLLIIKGGEKSIIKFRPIVIFEYNKESWAHSGSKWHDASDFFERNNHSLYLIRQEKTIFLNKNNPPPPITSCDILAVPN